MEKEKEICRIGFYKIEDMQDFCFDVIQYGEDKGIDIKMNFGFSCEHHDGDGGCNFTGYCRYKGGYEI